MAKRGGRPKKDKATVTRINTHKPNGAESKVIAPAENDSLELGVVILPSPDDAVKALGVLAELNDRQLQAHARFVESQTRTKALKAKWEELATELQTTIRRFTHKSDLPLFDAEEREADQARMEAGPEGVENASGLAPANEVHLEGAEPPAPSSEASEPF